MVDYKNYNKKEPGKTGSLFTEEKPGRGGGSSRALFMKKII